MNKLNLLKLVLIKIYRRKRSILMSVAIAFVAWFVAVIVTDRQSVITITNVPIEAKLFNAQAENLGFDIVKITPLAVDVKVKGPRWKIGILSKDDIVVTAVSFRNVISDGDYEIDLKADLKQIMPDVKIDSISKKSAIFSVDILKSKHVALTCNLPNVSAQEGFFIDSPICHPESLYVSGPKKLVDDLKTVQLNVNSIHNNLNSNKTFDADIRFISTSGEVMDSSAFNFNKLVKGSVDVRVYKKKQVPLTFMLKNAPKSLNLNLLKNCAKISPSSINLGLSSEFFNSFKELCMGYIDMRELDNGTKFNFKIDVPSGCKNIDQLESATVEFDTENWSSENFVIGVEDIQLVNVDSDYDVKIKSSILEKVKVVGFKNFLNNLNVKDITATVDLSNVKLRVGEQTVPVNVGILNRDGVWPVGFYKCCIGVKKHKK